MPKNKNKRKRGLGRGLSALMEDVRIDDVIEKPTKDTPKSPSDSQKTPTPSKNKNGLESQETPTNITALADAPVKLSEPKTGKGVTFVDLGSLFRNPEQPRRHFDPGQLNELAESIRKKGILQPILVRPIPDKSLHNKPVYQIIAGERRWTAAGMAGLQELPVFIRDITDEEALEIGVIENVHRADLNPMEEAMAYKALTTQFSRTQQEVATAVGKSRTYITNMMRLLSLPETVQDYLAENKLSIGHARAIIAAPDPEALANIIIDKQFSVRDAENWVRKLKSQQNTKEGPSVREKDADIRNLENDLVDALGLAVDIRHKGPHGELRLKYKTVEQLDELIRVLKPQ